MLYKSYNSRMRQIIVIAHDIRSTHNVGSLLRTAEGLGVNKLYLTGYTPHGSFVGDQRLPHVGQRQTKQINKTALGAENLINWEYHTDILKLITDLKAEEYTVIGLEQNHRSVLLPKFEPTDKVVLLLGREVEGLDDQLIAVCDRLVEIPMAGQKESFNVVQAAAMTLYHLVYCPFI